ncbi:hypothetical protein ARMSODRAFT_1017605 [Armillaria solidipes]|uniref:Uncharacterized protein n=1 Tax=Armillaria solidipes TaxID=1076256 RepID=A0A2H3BIU6_9AGAR|nr:hypothetical protein ARMSODRAFT_1017605 [Armillaria solidipes]
MAMPTMGSASSASLSSSSSVSSAASTPPPSTPPASQAAPFHATNRQKALVSGLVGGFSLLDTWGKEWREKFGGEEKDEVDALDIDLPELDDEDNDEEEEQRRKKPKVEVASPPPTTSVPAGPHVVPEKTWSTT